MSDLFGGAPPSISIDTQIKAVEREIGYRKYVYPRRVADGKMSQDKANTETAVMEAVLATLKKVKEGR